MGDRTEPAVAAAAAAATAAATSSSAVSAQLPSQRPSRRIPVSLGKASLRIRLEAYYSLIAPETLQNRVEWLCKYDQIYEKYGGTHQGERKLSSKLAMKYGTQVRLLLASSVEDKQQDGIQESKPVREEEWYQLRSNERNSGIISIVSNNFDPVAFLNAPLSVVLKNNPGMIPSNTNQPSAASLLTAHVLDNVDKFAIYLPAEDPQRRLPNTMKKSSQTDSWTSIKKNRNNKKIIHPFVLIAQNTATDRPFAVLHKLRNQNVTIVIRYVDAIRGTLTGTLLAFDKHFNMILRNAVESYSPRPKRSESYYETPKIQEELQPWEQNNVRISGETIDSEKGKTGKNQDDDGGPNTRQMKQLLVRGDMIVCVYGTSPAANQKPQKSRYYATVNKK